MARYVECLSLGGSASRGPIGRCRKRFSNVNSAVVMSGPANSRQGTTTFLTATNGCVLIQQSAIPVLGGQSLSIGELNATSSGV